MEARVGVAPTLTGLQPVTRNSRNRPCEEEVGVDPKPITGPSRFRDGVTRRGESSSMYSRPKADTVSYSALGKRASRRTCTLHPLLTRQPLCLHEL